MSRERKEERDEMFFSYVIYNVSFVKNRRRERNKNETKERIVFLLERNRNGIETTPIDSSFFPFPRLFDTVFPFRAK